MKRRLSLFVLLAAAFAALGTLELKSGTTPTLSAQMGPPPQCDPTVQNCPPPPPVAATVAHKPAKLPTLRLIHKK